MFISPSTFSWCLGPENKVSTIKIQCGFGGDVGGVGGVDGGGGGGGGVDGGYGHCSLRTSLACDYTHI